MPRKNFRLHIAFLGLVLVAAVPRTAPAQDSLQVAGQEQVHIVQLGETLWELARLYMGDPFLWPEIYRINTMVVEDPHWIFPGEELRLVPADETAVAVAPPEGEVPETEQGVERPVEPEPEEPVVVAPPPPPPPPPVRQDAPTVFVERQSAAGRPIPVGPTSSRSAVRRGDFYAAGFLSEGDDLPWAEVRGNVEPGAGGPFGNAPAMLHGRIVVRAPSGATYHVGDTLLIADLPREVPGWGDVVLPAGLARVTYAAGRDIEAEIVSQFSRISRDQVAMPVEPFRNSGSARPQPVQEGVSGQIVALRDLHPLPNQQNVIFIDRGRQDGIMPGDIFEIIKPSDRDGMGDRTPDRVATIQIVHVRERPSSGMILQIVRTGVRDGAPVRLIAKMPS